MWSASRDWEISVAAALLCHAGLLYGFQIALRPLATPEPRIVIEMALVPPPGDAKDGAPGRALVEAPLAAMTSAPPRAAEVRPPDRASRPLPPKPRRAPMPVPAAVPAPAEAPLRTETPAPVVTTAPQPGSGAPAGTGGRGAAGGSDGRSSETGSGSGTGPAALGVRATPRYRTNPAPIYPALARSRRQEGLVLVRVSVTAEGRPSRIELERSSGFSALDEAALEAVREWEFEPARVGARAVSSEIQVPVRFQLAD